MDKMIFSKEKKVDFEKLKELVLKIKDNQIIVVNFEEGAYEGQITGSERSISERATSL